MIDKLYRFFKDSHVDIEEDDFIYGLTNIIHQSVFAVILVPISLYLNTFVESCLFYILYSELRKYSGGIHMKRTTLCIALSLLVSITIPILTKKIIITSVVDVLIYSMINIFFISAHKSVQHKNKPLSEKEVDYYTRKAMNVELVYAIVSVCLNILNLYVISSLIIYTFTFCSIELVVLSIIKKLRCLRG